ncbi:MAG: hypothetical protein ACKVQK_18695 [Burkholderiales bacterium]
MKTKTLGALAALAVFGTAQMALADGDHRQHGRQGQGATTPGAETPQTPRAHGHSQDMKAHKAEMHERMKERHGAPRAGTQSPRSGQPPRDGEHSH